MGLHMEDPAAGSVVLRVLHGALRLDNRRQVKRRAATSRKSAHAAFPEIPIAVQSSPECLFAERTTAEGSGGRPDRLI